LKRRNATGQKFGRLTAECFDHVDQYGSTWWLFRCECGTKKVLRLCAVATGGTSSCGCLNRELIVTRSVKPNGEAQFNRLYKTYYFSAKKRGLIFALSTNEFRQLTKGCCNYCGVEPRAIVESRSPASLPYIYNGIDRRDSGQGYMMANCCSCCWSCNKAKRAMTASEFVEWIDRLASYRVATKLPNFSEGANWHAELDATP
jgi:hypothetical protein